MRPLLIMEIVVVLALLDLTASTVVSTPLVTGEDPAGSFSLTDLVLRATMILGTVALWLWARHRLGVVAGLTTLSILAVATVL